MLSLKSPHPANSETTGMMWHDVRMYDAGSGRIVKISGDVSWHMRWGDKYPFWARYDDFVPGLVRMLYRMI